MNIACRALVTAALVLCTGCLEDVPGRHVVVFIDRSCSVPDATMAGYLEDWRRVVASLQPGDRLTMGPITSETYATFRPVLDERLPRFNWLTDNKLRSERKMREAHTRLEAAFDRVRQVPCGQQTPLLDTVSLAEKLIGMSNDRPVLVLMSDMMEDAADVRFDRQPVSARRAQQIVSERRRIHRMADLKGATVYVSGRVVNVSNTKARDVEEFWQLFLRESHADTVVYGSSLLIMGGSDAVSPATVPEVVPVTPNGPTRKP